MNGWHNASKSTPCPICKHTDWCTMSDDGMMAVCRRVESNKTAKSGIGWIHIIVEAPRRYVPHPPRRPVINLFNVSRVMDGYRSEFAAENAGHDIFDSLIEISDDLRLVAAHIDRLEVGRSAFNEAWAFPMRDGLGDVVGIRLRRYHSSDKWSVSGSKDGLFYDPDLEPIENVYNGVKGREIVIVEGATDTIAGYSIGLPAVGRSSCNTGAEHIRTLCNRLRVSRVTIVADNDLYKERPGTSTRPPSRWRPGLEGAEKLAKDLGRTFRIFRPPEKDLREWLVKGLTSQQFWDMANLKKWRIK